MAKRSSATSARKFTFVGMQSPFDRNFVARNKKLNESAQDTRNFNARMDLIRAAMQVKGSSYYRLRELKKFN